MGEQGQIIPDVIRLYRKDDLYSDLANEISGRARTILEPLYREAKERGYSFRDLSHLIASEVREMEAEYQILRGMEANEKKNPRPKFAAPPREEES